MLEILQSFGIPVIFIRYNPDKYNTEDKQLESGKRERILIECINKCIKSTPSKNRTLFENNIFIF